MNGDIPDNNRDLNDAWRAAELITKFIQHEISEAEQRELDAWRKKSDSNERLFLELTDEHNVEKAKLWMQDIEKQREKVLASVKQKIKFNPPRRSSPLRSWWVAAAVLAIIVTGVWYYNKGVDENIKEKESFVVKSQDIPPGTNTATLQLSDGSVIDLAKTKSIDGKFETRLITKTDGAIQYSDSLTSADDSYNTLTTPAGGQYMIVLGDGSKAWLNAGSSLRYPLFFKKQRTVEATGEVYFEVEKSKVPFIVKVKDAEIEVLGTHFNIDAYKTVHTTLLEGSVRLSRNKEMQILKPGEMGTAGEKINVKKLEYPDDVMAWKNGEFRFARTPIKDIMEQLARWYRIEVSYEGSFDNAMFSVTAKRNENISTILNNIQKTGHIHFRIEGMHVTVLP